MYAILQKKYMKIGMRYFTVHEALYLSNYAVLYILFYFAVSVPVECIVFLLLYSNRLLPSMF